MQAAHRTRNFSTGHERDPRADVVATA